jgi:hypothetical protein
VPCCCAAGPGTGQQHQGLPGGQGQLEDDRVYFIDANLGQAESDGRVVTPMHLDAE